jgi:adenine/guanine phosphoribosyltransferase-like PRPP-binding protein
MATGGTMRAAAELATLAGYQVLGLAALIDLRLVGDFIWHELPLRCVIRYD